MSLVRAKKTTFVSVGGKLHKIAKGELVSEDSPVVREHGSYFEELSETVPRYAANVERATAEPGERRSVVPRPDPEEKPAPPKGAVKPPAKPAAKGRQDGEV